MQAKPLGAVRLRVPGRPSKAAAIAAGVVIAFACLLAALVSASGDFIVVGVFTGLVLGLFLLMAPRLALWACVIGALLVSGFVSLFLPSLVKAPTSW